MKRAIVTVGISDARHFAPYLDRWYRTFRQWGGADYLKVWHREWPPNSPTHRECHYAFKVHAVREAAERGCTSILWMDSSCWAIGPLDALWERLERDGHILIDDANRLGNWSSDHSLGVFGVSRDEAMSIQLMCGTCWGLDLMHERSRTFLERLHNFAVPEHFIGTHVSRLPGLPRPQTEGELMSTDPRCRGHRSDEVYMSLLAHDLGMVTGPGVEFVGGGPHQTPEARVRSGYDLPPPEGGAPGDCRPKRARELACIAEHTVDLALLQPDGISLDVGCRNFGFARGLAERGNRVVALDADPTIEDPGIEGVSFLNLALADAPGARELVMSEDPQARYLAPAGGVVRAGPAGDRVTVAATTLRDLMGVLGADHFDVVKLDVEGAEYGILRNWPGPVATQISIEFHEHVAPQPQAVYDEIFKHLGRWYEVVKHVADERHCAGKNFWDSLLLLR